MTTCCMPCDAPATSAPWCDHHAEIVAYIEGKHLDQRTAEGRDYAVRHRISSAENSTTQQVGRSCIHGGCDRDRVGDTRYCTRHTPTPRPTRPSPSEAHALRTPPIGVRGRMTVQDAARAAGDARGAA